MSNIDKKELPNNNKVIKYVKENILSHIQCFFGKRLNGYDFMAILKENSLQSPYASLL